MFNFLRQIFRPATKHPSFRRGWGRLLLLLPFTAAAGGGFFSGFTTEGHIGYNIGGSAPLGMPATIRSLDRFSLTPNINFGASATKHFSERWGVKVGVRFENKGMDIDAGVKNYHMEITKGGESLAGVFTGNVVSRADLWMFTIPVQATFDVSKKVRLRGGLFGSYLTGRKFTGWAYDGYLRKDDPTGVKVELGSGPDERGDYDFSPNLRHWQWGAVIGADWYFHRRLGVYAELDWGFSGIFESGFHTVEQTLRPIYGSIGLTYRLH